MAEPITLTCIAVAATATLMSKAVDYIEGVAINRIDGAICGTIKQVAGPLWEDFVHKGNHDLQKGLNEVYQDTLKDMAQECHRIARNTAQKTYAAKLKDFATQKLPLTSATAQSLEPVMTTLLGGALEDDQDRYQLTIDRLITDIIDHYGLLLGPMPEPFQAVFRFGSSECAPWNERFRHHLAQLIKADGGVRFEKIYSAQTLSRIFDKQMAFGEIARALNRDEVFFIEAHDASNTELLSIIGINLTTALTAQDPTVAVKWIIERLKCEDGEVSFYALWDEFTVWYEKGSDQGLNLECEVAIHLARESIKRATTPDEKGDALNDLGIALSTLGEREAGTERLDEAVESFRHALLERARETAPLDWAMTQNSLGIALFSLGEREADSKRLNEAVEAYRLSLLEYTRERVPLHWATTQNNLGNALSTLGEREADPIKALGRLNEAVDAFRLALLEFTRVSVPLDWAMTQMNLGDALRNLGEREEGTGRIEEAVVAFRLALEECKRECVPLQWAMTQNNLGNALSTLGERESDIKFLEESVEAYKLALLEYNRERVPLDWAMTQENLSLVHRAFYDKTHERSHLQTALTHAETALEVYELAGAEYYITKCQNLIAELKAL